MSKRDRKKSISYTIISYTYTSLKRILKISVKSKSQDRIFENFIYYNIYTIIYYNTYIIISYIYIYVEEEIENNRFHIL